MHSATLREWGISILSITVGVGISIIERKARDMVKCPNCGSTAQLHKIYQADYVGGGYANEEWQCGCGCYFRALYKLKLVNIKEIKNEKNN